MAAASTPTAPAEAKKMDEQNQALEKAAPRTPAIIQTPEEYRGALRRWQEQHYNVLTPFTNLSGLAPCHGIITSVVQVNPDKTAGEVYDNLPFLKENEVALAKSGLRKLAECAGISTQTQRTDDRRIQFYWEFKAIASYRGVDGSIVTREATKEWDLRDGSPQLKGWTRNQIEEGRKHGLRNCEARAINAAIRECGFGVKQKYAKAELARPFVIVRVMFQPDMTDPEIKRMVTAAALGGTTTLYPGSRPALDPSVDVEEVPHEEPRQVGSGSTSSTPAGATEASKADQDVPPVEGAVRIEKVETKSGETGGRKWTRFIIIDSNGVAHSTFDKSIADAAEKAVASKAWMEIVEETDGQYKNLVEIAPAGQNPSLPGLGDL